MTRSTGNEAVTSEVRVALLDVEALDDASPWTRHRVPKGSYLARAGPVPTSLFVVRLGCFRVSMPGGMAGGRVVDFAMRGDWLGTESLTDMPWSSDVVALEDGEVLALPAKQFEEAAWRASRLRSSLYRHFAHTMLRDRRHIAQLVVLNARQRLALFLLDLSERLAAVDGSGSFVLPMLRSDIGSYLGLALESVSRAFSDLHGQGVIRVRLRVVELRDRQALRGIALHIPTVR